MQIGKHNLHILLACAAGMAVAMDDQAGASGSGNGDKKKQEIITAPEPAAPNDYVDMTKQLFHFKTEKLRDEKGNVVGEGKKHPSVEIYLPVPKPTKLAEFLLSEGMSKEKELILSAVTDQIYRVARQQINDIRDKDSDAQITPASINYDKLDWVAIANMPKSERGSYVPDEEDVKAFLTSYKEVMPKATGKTSEKIDNHIVCFQSNFKKQRAQKEILEMFKDALAIYVSSAGEEAVGEHADVIEYYNGRLDRMLRSEEKITMEDL